MFFKDERERGSCRIAGTSVKESTSDLMAWSISVLFKPDSFPLLVKHRVGIAYVGTVLERKGRTEAKKLSGSEFFLLSCSSGACAASYKPYEYHRPLSAVAALPC